MLKYKTLTILIGMCGGLNILAAIEVESLLLAIVTGLCGIITVVVAALLSHYIKHIGDVKAHTPPESREMLVTEVTCGARVKGITDRLDDVHTTLKSLLKVHENNSE